MAGLTRFVGLPAMSTPGAAKLAVLGVAEASPYVPGQASHAAGGPEAIRAASELFRLQLKQFDYDLGGTLVRDDEKNLPGLVGIEALADEGNVPTDAGDPAGNRAQITAAVRALLDGDTAPLVLGGDDSVPIPVLQAFEGHQAGRGPLTILQIDAHVDWGDVIRGNPLGYGSTMRRASEMPWVGGMVQVGMRGLGSGLADQLDQARAWGSRIVPMPALRRAGVEAALALLPEGGDIFITVDCDGLDPSIIPAVNMPTPGGLDMVEVTALIMGAASRGRVVGCTLVELAPEKDHGTVSAITAARIALTLLGAMARTLPPHPAIP